MKEYKKLLTIGSAEADSRQNYRAFSFMCDAQEIANEHATSLGFGYNQFIQTNTAWVLSRMKVVFIKPPKWQEEVSVTTWHKGIEGVFSLRDFEVRDARDESPLIVATSSWLIIDLNSRRMLRTDHAVPEESYTSSINSRDAIAERCGKIISPADATMCASRKVQYSDIDFNHHVNNAKYMEWALDTVDPAILTTRDIDYYQINFIHEATLGETIDFYLKQTDADCFHIDGKRGGDLIFQTILKLKP